MRDDERLIHTDEIIDQTGPMRPLQLLVVVLCVICVLLDGFDVQAIGYVAPVLVKEWGIAKADLTPVFTLGLVGMVIGSFALSALADRIGRRPVLIGSTVAFALCMIATGFAQTIPQLAVARLLTGIGLGGVMPNAMALAGEFSPQRIRVTIMMIVACGFTAGAAIGGLVSVGLINLAGWHSVFFIGGMLPLLLVPLMVRYLPESLEFQARRGVPIAAVSATLQRLRPDLECGPQTRLVTREAEAERRSVFDLFAPERRRATTVLWGINLFNLTTLYFLSSWLPTLLAGAKLPQNTAILAGTLVQVGGVIGTLAMGFLIDRIGFKRVLIPAFVIAAFALLAIGQLWSVAALYLIAFVAGFCIMGAQPAVNSLAASVYPTQLRSTGIGWSLGFGRIGSIAGPLIGGLLVASGWASGQVLALLAIPAIGSALLMVAMPIVRIHKDAQSLRH